MNSKKILILNPNSSKSVTRSMIQLVQKPPAGFELVFMTAPKDAPATIDNEIDAEKSAKACMNLFKSNPKKFLCFDGYLICCFSDHPLIYQLRDYFKNLKMNSPVILGIFQSSITFALSQIGGPKMDKIVIFTSGTSWKPILNNAVYHMLIGQDISSANPDWSKLLPPYFLPTAESGAGVLEISDPSVYKDLTKKIQLLKNEGAKYVILGCAGFSGMDHKFKKDFPDMVFIDTVKCGIDTICAYVRFHSSM